jgi:hypothetical protein
MRGSSYRRWLLSVLAIQVVLLAPPRVDAGGNSRWGDFGAEVQGGSFGLSFQKRLAQPGMEEEVCERCRQYLEFGFEWDEFDDDGRAGEGDVDVDSTAFTIGYRYYVLTGDGPTRKKEGLAAYLAVGLGRYDLDPGEAEPGYYGKAALEYPITQSAPKEDDLEDGESWKLKKAFWSVIGSVRYDEIERAESNLDDVSFRVGLRLVVPSRRDRQRALCLHAWEPLLAGKAFEYREDREEFIMKNRPGVCLDPEELEKLEKLPPRPKEGQDGSSAVDSR